MFRLGGKVALVTGGYGGIGVAVCRRLAGMGVKVAVAGHDAHKGANSLKGDGTETYDTAFDAAPVAQRGSMVGEVAEHFGRLDILVNCVGLNREEKAEEVTEERFDHVPAAQADAACAKV